LPVTQRAGVGLVVNDFPKIALQLGAECCHLGQEDFFDTGYTMAEQVTGLSEGDVAGNKHAHTGASVARPARRAGLPRHRPRLCHRHQAGGTARDAGLRPMGAANVPIPWFAIGGITLQNLDAVLAAGARAVCVVSAILNAPDIAKACQELSSA